VRASVTALPPLAYYVGRTGPGSEPLTEEHVLRALRYGGRTRPMESFIIRGGRSLHGRVRVSGAKNSTLPLLAATARSGAGERGQEFHSSPPGRNGSDQERVHHPQRARHQGRRDHGTHSDRAGRGGPGGSRRRHRAPPHPSGFEQDCQPRSAGRPHGGDALLHSPGSGRSGCRGRAAALWDPGPSTSTSRVWRGSGPR